MFGRVSLILILGVSALASACSSESETLPASTLDMTQVARAVALTLQVESQGESQQSAAVIPSAIPTRTPISTPALPLSDSSPTVLGCDEADSYEGETITCQMNRAHCNYRPDVNGGPTFCNDGPFPDHSFTLLVWGQDWSDYDGLCLWVTGEVLIYQDKPQIEAESRSQVVPCP